jgi:hypothetical protein
MREEGNQCWDLLDVVKNDTSHTTILNPMNGDAEERYDVWGGPAIDRKV